MSRKQDTKLLLSQKDRSDKSLQDTEDSVHLVLGTPGVKPAHALDLTISVDTSDKPKKYSPKPPFWRWITFMDMLPFVRRIYKAPKAFNFEDIPNPEYAFSIEERLVELDRQWTRETHKPQPSFSMAIAKAFRKEVTQGFVISIIENVSRMYCSIYMGKIVKMLTSSDFQENLDSKELLSSATILSVLISISIFARCRYFFAMGAHITRLRFTIAGVLYKKLNRTSLTAVHDINLGKVINLVGNDLGDLYGLWFLPTTIISPFLIALGIYLMWGYFGPLCLITLIPFGLVTVCQSYLSKWNKAPCEENKKMADERIKYTHEVIEGIRLIKMYTWDKIFKQKINQYRQNEHKAFTQMVKLDTIGINLSNLSVYFSILLLCIVYTALGGVLSSEKVYATMMILTCLSGCLVTAHSGRMSLVNVRLVIGRIEQVLKVKEVVSKDDEPIKEVETPAYQYLPQTTKPVVFKDFTGYWNHTATKPCLSDINLTLNPGTLTAVIGKIGAGKSTLLLSFLKELPLTQGVLDFSGKVAYVEQDPIIFSGTLRENILFGKEYDEFSYKQVIRDCNLERDLQMFSHGDLTRIGERGVNLSGGQKARVSLARALYSQSDIYLLDDPFSALDSRVSRDIFDRVLKGDLMKQKIVILVTHHLHFAKESDHVVFMDDGQVVAQGTFSDLESLNLSLLSIFKIDHHEKASNDEELDGAKEKKKTTNVDDTVAQVQEEETPDEPVQVTWQTYKDYLRAKGSWSVFLLIFGLIIASNVLMLDFVRFIGRWAEDQTRFNAKLEKYGDLEFHHGFYILRSIISLISILIFNQMKTIKMYNFFLSTNTELHQRMLNTLLRSKVQFFDTNPVGRILSRFSGDLGGLDKQNPRQMFEVIDSSIGYITLLITVCIINPAILLPILIIFYGLIYVKRLFYWPVVVGRKLELICKGPLLSAVPATLQGLTVIRAYNQGSRFVQQFMDMLYTNVKVLIFMERTIRLFTFMLDALIALLTVLGIWIFIILILYYNFEASLLGLCFMSLLKIGEQGSILIRQLLWVELNMQSAQRMLDYCNLKEERPEYIPKEDSRVEREFQGQWPAKGEIVFNNIFLRYREELGFALNGLSLKVPGGLKVACVGRTGAGKSSIIQALFRMVEIERESDYKDSSIEIDGVDIGSIGLKLLRSRLSIIPQTPVVFANTIKKNLDPFGHLTDDELWKVLEDIGLRDYIESLPKQLETDMTVSAAVFSTGQKQLVCLARAIISKSKVIILDEATANVDVETDSFIQKTIMEKFKECTVLTVAHRLITIANYDKVVVIDSGRVVEYDSPYALLVEKIGDNQITKTNSVFAEMVKSTGVSMSNKIFETAREKFMSQE